MKTNRRTTEIQLIEHYRIALENAVSNPEIAPTLAEFGYDDNTLRKGKALWQAASDAYFNNKTEDDEKSKAYAIFSNKRKELASTYSLHRKKAKVIFRKDPLTLETLGIKGRIPQAYIKWLEVVKKFYTTATADQALVVKLSRLKITAEELTHTQSLISSLEEARSIYIDEKGDSQEATKVKDAALATLDDWMSEFYAVAKIAFEDHPQRLESLSKHIKS